MTKASCTWALALLVLALGACASDDSAMRNEEMADKDMSIAEELAHIDPFIARQRDLEAEALGITDEVAWSFKTGMNETFTRVFENGRWLLAETYNAQTKEYAVHSIDLAKGREQWVLVIGENPLARAPHVGDGTIAFLTENDGGLIVVNAITGGRLHTFRSELGVIPASDATSKGDTVYLANYLTGRISAVAADGGRKGWDFYYPKGLCLTTPVLASAQSYQNLVYGTTEGALVGLRAKRHDEVPPTLGQGWARMLPGGAIGADMRYAEIPGDGETIADQGVVVVPTEGGLLYGIIPTTGRSRWVLHTDMPFKMSPKIMNGRVYAKNANRMFCLDLASGERVWWPEGSMELSDYERTNLFREPVGYELLDRALAANDDRVLMLQGMNKVVRCDNEGKIDTELELPSFDFFISNEIDGHLILGTADGYFMAFK